MPANCTYLGIASSKSYVERTNVEFMKLSARGITLVASSGDSGAPGDINSDCSFDGNTQQTLNPEYPGSSPFVLSVGATQLLSFTTINSTSSNHTPIPLPCKPGFFWKGFICASNGTEQTASVQNGALITTGGGFSVYSARPAWQNHAVENYLKQNQKELPPPVYFNASNRAYPDVSALGHNVLLYLKGYGSKGWSNFDGTSASAPIWGGIITLLNDARQSVNKSTLGMVAPMLYAMYYSNGSGGGGGSGSGGSGSGFGFGFTDISGGNNKCTRNDGMVALKKMGKEAPICCKYGFTSATNSGWDPVTGLGSPRFDELLHYVKEILP